MANILIAYSTVDGHTRKICERLQEVLESQQQTVSIFPIEKDINREIASFDKIIIGSSIRYGNYRPELFEFISKNLSVLNNKPSAFFSVNMVARKPQKAQPETNPYLQKFLKKSPWQPKTLAVFAGQIDYPKYGFFDRVMIQFIMKITKGPTDRHASFEFTDWTRVEAFAETISQM
ncbi:menaquinone-dependent protoporphyrinogen IX dehydrogenase [Thiomicrorhabdus sp.]|uniref:menaquinone-dependent protoporphyrinogen IX dehydrogenase n=1 Tax=Thiomicrorhabdus sp. TaxID=2039724 RepID=UPI0029C703D3|nr:menaquinone-dependent protoporphyrinogen IX dehydrogenase [Thiomicrorhabdus sp.]